MMFGSWLVARGSYDKTIGSHECLTRSRGQTLPTDHIYTRLTMQNVLGSHECLTRSRGQTLPTDHITRLTMQNVRGGLLTKLGVRLVCGNDGS